MPDPKVVEHWSRMIQMLVSGGGSVAGAVRDLAPGVPKEILDAARLSYEKKVGLIRELKDPNVLVNQEVEDGYWYAGPKDDDTFWPELRKQLEPKLPAPALGSVDMSSTKILSLMRPPGVTTIRTRGLVLGYVQSGKTTSFMSVAAKAADVGYRMIIVLSGVTDNLRSQTQARLTEQLVGDLDNKWFTLTKIDEDFQSTENAAAMMTSDQHRLLVVVKKNPYRLRRLAKWLESGGEAALRSCPILLIDDEADQGSIDVGKNRMSVINGLIRRILNSPKAAYVAYTATPFANLLIDPAVEEGLYPRNFIVDLPPGSDYYGPERLFGRDVLEHYDDDSTGEPDDVIRSIPTEDVADVQPPKGKGAVFTWDPSIVPSLASAIDWFVLATAARWARGDNDVHSSMLVHTSMLAEAHFRLQDVVVGHCNALLAAIGDDQTRDRLELLWTAEYGRVPAKPDESAVTFEQVFGQVPDVLAIVRVIVDNYKSTERLTYKQGEVSACIAIGGNTLSRGLTLDGLVSSYFVRAASAYDTLLQMGRWFGYRGGYSDLVRIWMTDELAIWVRDLATVEAEIRREIMRYEAEGLDPSQLAVKIRTHPAMAITSAAKMKHAVTSSLSYSGKREQTILFRHQDAAWLDKNWQAGISLLEQAAADPDVERGLVPGSGRFVLRSVPASAILKFLEEYEFHEDARRLSTKLLTSYIKQEQQEGGLLRWNIVVMSTQKDEVGTAEFGEAGTVNLASRSRTKPTEAEKANIKSLAGPRDRAADIGDDLLQGMTDPSDADIRNARESIDANPMLALYPIAKGSEAKPNAVLRADLEAVSNVLGVTFFFPGSRNPNSTVGYVSADLSSLAVEDPDLDAEIAAMDKADQDLGESTAAEWIEEELS